jgi:hypothetical protein
MSQFSQFSDQGPSSLFEDDIDTFSYIPTDEPSIFTSDPSSFTADTDSPLFSVPTTLKRIGPDNKKLWVLYSEMSKNDFINWWLQTEYGSLSDHRKKIRWDAKRSSSAWDNYDQVAHHVSGEPRIMCRRCGKDFPHPHQHANGTNSMKRDYEANKCRRAGNSAVKQQTIQQSIEFAVCYIISYNIYLYTNLY